MPREREMKALFFRLLEQSEGKAGALQSLVASRQGEVARNVFELDPATFGQVPRSPFAYWASAAVRRKFIELDPFASEGRVACVGLQTSDNFRFLRLAWEVPPSLYLKCWWPYSKGGVFSPHYSDLHLIVNWQDEGEEMKAWAGSLYNNSHWSRILKNLEFSGRPGITWPSRTQSGFGPRPLPSRAMFDTKGNSAFVHGDGSIDLLSLCAIANSAPFRALLALQLAAADAAARSYDVGVVQRTPVPGLSEVQKADLAKLALASWSLRRFSDTSLEASHAFHLPALLQAGVGLLCARSAIWSQRLAESEAEFEQLEAEIDEQCFALYGIDHADREQIECGLPGSSEGEEGDAEEGSDDEGPATSELNAASLVASLLSWTVGVAFGRFDLRLATGGREATPPPGPFNPLPACSPGMMTDKDGLPFEEPPERYLVSFPRDGILIDDIGAERDLVARVRQVFDEVFPDPAARWEEAAEILGEEDRTLRTWFARKFFGST